MKKLLLLALLLEIASASIAQCTTGYNSAQLDWDFLDYLPSTGHGSYTNLSQSQTQYFVLGGQRIEIKHNYSNGTNISAIGENQTHTAEANSYGAGADLEFQQNGVITINFNKPVLNVKFSIYDIDYSQQVVISALNSGSGTNISLTRASGTQLSITNNNTASATVAGPASTVISNASTDGTVNVDITGPVTSVTLTITGAGTFYGKGNKYDPATDEDGSFWISDISACTPTITGGNYFQVAKPYAGQPGYVLIVKDNTVYYVNPADGKAKILFTDPGHTNINSLAYDPVNRYVYYAYSLTGPVVDNALTTNASNKSLRRYDYNLDTFGIAVQDVGSIGAPTLDAGVESGAAAFYNGSLYLGIEAKSEGAFESTIWKVDFNGANPYQASQQFAVNGVGHDWSDFGLSNDTLYDFDGVSTAANRNFYHMSLKTGTTLSFTPATGIVPRQTSTDWNGQVFNVGTAAASAAGTIVPYLYNGNVNASLERTITLNGVAISGSWGDAADAFVPKVDFGDAPASYDPVTADPAIHEMDSALHIGASLDKEWSKKGAATTADSDTDDGLAYTTILQQNGNYQSTVKVYNNTGADATLIAWLDYNGNGIFDASEGTTPITVTYKVGLQSIDLYWPNVSNTLANNSFTYLRIRLTSATSGLTTAKPNGYMYNGEVEDYRVLVSSTTLDTRLVSFTAQKNKKNEAVLAWEVANDEAGATYELQKSSDGSNWANVNIKKAQQQQVKMQYSFLDKFPYDNVTYYRVKITEQGITKMVSDIKTIALNNEASVSFTPNPASQKVNLLIESNESSQCMVRMYTIAGVKVFENNYALKVGTNVFSLKQAEQWPSGVYQTEVYIGAKKYQHKLIIKR